MAKASDLYVDVPVGQYLFREGDAGAEMYIIESGSIAIQRGTEPLAVLEPGDFLGEMAILEDQPRFASAQARSDTRLLRIERAAFADLLKQNVEIAVRIMRKLALRQRRAELRVSELQQELLRLRAAPVAVPAPMAPPPAAVSPPSAVSPPPAVAPSPVVSPPAVAPPPVAVPPVPAAVPVAVAPPAAPAAARMGGLVLVHAASGQRFPLDPGCAEFLVGRVDPVTGITPEINLGPFDTARTLSRRHAKLLRQGALLFLREEVGTANGTFLNGQRVVTGEAMPLKPGDRLRFGTIDIELAAL